MRIELRPLDGLQRWHATQGPAALRARRAVPPSGSLGSAVQVVCQAACQRSSALSHLKGMAVTTGGEDGINRAVGSNWECTVGTESASPRVGRGRRRCGKTGRRAA